MTGLPLPSVVACSGCVGQVFISLSRPPIDEARVDVQWDDIKNSLARISDGAMHDAPHLPAPPWLLLSPGFALHQSALPRRASMQSMFFRMLHVSLSLLVWHVIYLRLPAAGIPLAFPCACAGLVPKLCWACANVVLGLCQSCAGLVPKLCVCCLPSQVRRSVRL